MEIPAEGLPDEVVDLLTWLRVERGRSPNTLAAYRNDLRGYVAWLAERGTAIDEVSSSDIEEYLHHLRSGGRAPSSLKRAAVSVRGLHRFLAEEHEGRPDPTADVELPKVPRGLPKALSEDEVMSVLATATGDDPLDRRDRVILEVLYGTGLRIAELVGLSLGDLDLDAGLLRAFGKGSKERIVPLGRHAIRSLVEWLGPGGRPEVVPDRWARRGDEEALLLNTRGGRLSRQGAWMVVRRSSSFSAMRRCWLYTSVTSWKTSTVPVTSPLLSRIGAQLSAIWYSTPLRLMRVVWLARPNTRPLLSTLATGLTAGWRVWALMMWNTSVKSLPAASSSFHPVSFSATGFMRVMRPSASVEMTASPMELKVA